MTNHASLSSISYSEIVKLAEENANNLKLLTTHQIRNFFKEISQIKMEFDKNKKKWSPDIETMVVMLKPTLAYSAGRIKEVKKFKEFIEPYIDSLLKEENKEENLLKFFSLVESFIAYHKFYGGKDH